MTDRTDFRRLSEYKLQKSLQAIAEAQSIENPFFRVHEGRAGPITTINGADHINFASYDYLGLNGDARVAAAAIQAITTFGTSVSASRLVAGERPFHRELEHKLADVYEVEDAAVLVSGHATNVSLVGKLLGPQDLLVHDELIHNSIIVGGQLARATRIPVRHNDLAHFKHVLQSERGKFRRCLIAIEGLYSMDGDVPKLAEMVSLKREHESWLLVDEAHALGVLGKTGLGSGQLSGVSGQDVDIWMGTLSKTLASSGGYVAGSKALIDYVKSAAPSFVYSVGLAPPNAAAAAAALDIMLAEPDRVRRLHANSGLMLKLAKEAALDVGSSVGAAIIPLRVGDSVLASRWSNALLAEGVNVLPIIYPAVPFEKAILRFFVTAAHSESQIRTAIDAVTRTRRQVTSAPPTGRPDQEGRLPK